jgi:hypothetical protein
MRCSNERKHYTRILQYMFAGDVGEAIDCAMHEFKQFRNLDINVNAIDLRQLQHFSIARVTGESNARYFNTYHFDWKEARRSKRNRRCTPRVGSIARVKCRTGGVVRQILLRIMVSFFFVLCCIE